MEYDTHYLFTYEVILTESLELYTSNSMELASIGLFGAIQETNAIIIKLQKIYGETFVIKSWITKI